ncbi:putative glycoside hydrolase family 15 protein [Myxococcota bacterium]|nr:putative glycoside hydrolase family 15 protein [Myxococcota bacterium]
MSGIVLSLLLSACGVEPGPALQRWQEPPDSGHAGDGGGPGGDGGGTGGDGGGPGGDGGGEEIPAEPTAGLRGLLVVTSWDREEAALATGAGAGQYRFIVLPLSLYTHLDEIRAANPDARLLAYQKVGGMRDDGGDYASTGVLISEAEEAAGEGWFLHDADGARLEYCDYAGVAVADVGDPAYQERWLDNVSARLARDGWDGVFMDDVNVFPGHCLGSLGTPIAEYATDQAYGDAVISFMQAVGPALAADGFLVAPNVAMNPWEDWMLAAALDVAASSTHVLREYWMRWDDSEVFTGDMWLSTLLFSEQVEALGRSFLALTYGPGDEGAAWGQAYGRASFLLAWDGEQDSAWGYLDDEVDPWSELWAGDLGLPVEARTAVGVGWRRTYSGGVVLVNPDPAEDQVFPLDAPYLTAAGERVQEVRLAPGEGVWLRASP